MKSLRVFLCLLIAGALMTACEKNNVEELNAQDPLEERLAKAEQHHEDYVAKHGEITIEYLTLEELNADYVKYGMEPVTLEQLGVTQLEYEEAQARINNPNYAKSRCSNTTLAGSYGDVNGGGSLTSYDNFLANKYFIVGTNRTVTSSTPLVYQNFALLSYFYSSNEEDVVDEYDTYIASRAILGIISCDL